MIWAIVWKEWREQRAIALAVLAFGVLALVLTAQFADPAGGGSMWSQAGARELMAQGLAYLAGTVCGAMLLADEKEIGTLEFLDTLPARRRTLWAGKVTFGVGLALFQSAIMAGLAIAFGCVDQRVSPVAYAAVVMLVGLLAFAWGMFGGSLAKSTLGAVFQGSIGSVITGSILAVGFTFLFGPRTMGRPFGPVMTGFYLAWLGTGLLASGLVYTAVDRERRATPIRPGLVAHLPKKRPSRRAGLRALLWLSTRQAAYLALGAFAAAGIAAAIMLAPEAQPVFVWPMVTLALGVLAGITTFNEEQTRGVARFWAERRLPMGRLWLTKVGFHLGLAVAAGLVLFLPLLIAHPASPFRTRLLSGENLRVELGRFLLLGLVYGFAVGHLAGMVFRKAAVAGLVASVVAATLLALIYPSVIGGGAHAWQVWGPAVVLLATARFLLYPWATERITSRGPVLRAVGGTAAALLVLGAGLAYRVYEIPDVHDRLAESGFRESIPSVVHDEGRRYARAAVTKYRSAVDDAQADYPRPPESTVGGGPNGRGGSEAQDALQQVVRRGWGPEAQGLERWLNRVYAGEWVQSLEQLVARPAEVYFDPQDRDAFTPSDEFRVLEIQMGPVLLARGLQRLAAGDPDAYPRLLRGGLALARSARAKGTRSAARATMAMEEVLLRGLADWIRQAPARSELYRALLADLVRHERETPVGPEDAYWAHQVILRNTMDRVGNWVAQQNLTTSRAGPAGSDPQADSEAELVALAWNVPWERARRERILRVHTHPTRDLPVAWLSGLHLKRQWIIAWTEEDAERDLRVLALRRLAVLQVALRLYELDQGRVAPDLAALAPEYLPSVPSDPYTGARFGYRVSAGEQLKPRPVLPTASPGGGSPTTERAAFVIGGPMGVDIRVDTPIRPMMGLAAVPRGAPVDVAPGDAVLWSAGPDRTDDGGRHPLSPEFSLTGEDWIVIVPAIVKPPK
ncbi:MAG TPA: hypothetical protein VKD90_09090 [Gemmataceae bacterium]|nr:hypothetical protein [Gemmataceae bacterium]